MGNAKWVGATLSLALLAVLCYYVLSAEPSPSVPPPSTTWSIGPGFVRSVIYTSSYYSVIFETDAGTIYSFGICSEHPPLWTGMHGTLEMDGCRLRRVDHLPPDDPYEPRPH